MFWVVLYVQIVLEHGKVQLRNQFSLGTAAADGLRPLTNICYPLFAHLDTCAGPNAASLDLGVAQFSEAVPSPGVTGVEIRGATVSSWSCDSNSKVGCGISCRNR